jgi:hypothetical protein
LKNTLSKKQKQKAIKLLFTPPNFEEHILDLGDVRLVLCEESYKKAKKWLTKNKKGSIIIRMDQGSIGNNLYISNDTSEWREMTDISNYDWW